MKRIISKILLLACLVFAMAGCSPDYFYKDSQRETNSGKNVVSFMCNGVSFYQDYYRMNSVTPTFLHLNASKDSIHIHSALCRFGGDSLIRMLPMISIYIALDDLRDYAEVGNKAQFFFNGYTKSDSRTVTSSLKPEIEDFKLTIRRWDSQNLILSGNFSIRGHLNGSQFENYPFTITQGNFDVSENKAFIDLFGLESYLKNAYGEIIHQ